MTDFRHDRTHMNTRFLDFIVGAAVIVMIFNLTAMLAITLLRATAPSHVTFSELSTRPNAVTEIEKRMTTTTPKEDRKPLPAPPTIDRS